MEIEFDPDKAAVNPVNHDGVTFEEARGVLIDPYALTREDIDANGEQTLRDVGHGRTRARSGGGVDASGREDAPDFRLESQPTAMALL